MIEGTEKWWIPEGRWWCHGDILGLQFPTKLHVGCAATETFTCGRSNHPSCCTFSSGRRAWYAWFHGSLQMDCLQWAQMTAYSVGWSWLIKENISTFLLYMCNTLGPSNRCGLTFLLMSASQPHKMWLMMVYSRRCRWEWWQETGRLLETLIIICTHLLSCYCTWLDRFIRVRAKFPALQLQQPTTVASAAWMQQQQRRRLHRLVIVSLLEPITIHGITMTFITRDQRDIFVHNSSLQKNRSWENTMIDKFPLFDNTWRGVYSIISTCGSPAGGVRENEMTLQHNL